MELDQEAPGLTITAMGSLGGLSLHTTNDEGQPQGVAPTFGLPGLSYKLKEEVL